MECYNCGSLLAASDYCPKCSADVRVYKKIRMASNSFYNEGLDRAYVRNLSGAIESLKKSLQLNKMNMDARNLLGLIYFEMGETVAALSEWVISKNYHSRGNAASRYLNEIQNNPSKLETVNQTIKKYNQALLYCRQDSKDLAAIQLKKVLSLNPKLVKGHQLLALLYIEEGKFDYANKALKNAAKIDENNTITLRYQKEISHQLKDSSSKKQKKEELISYQSGNDTVIMPAHFKDNSAWQTIWNILIGVGLGIALTMFLLIPNIRQQSKTEENEALKEANDMISKKEQALSSMENEKTDLERKKNDAEEAMKQASSKLVSYEQLLNAFSSYTADDMEAAETAMEGVNGEDLSGSAKTMFQDLTKKINEKYLVTLYQEGYDAYNKGDFTTAIEKLSKVVEINERYQDGYAVYYLAQSYRRNNNMEQAVIYYQKVITLYPGSQRANQAQNYIGTSQQAGTATQNWNQPTGTDVQNGSQQPAGGSQQPAGEWQQPAGGQSEPQGE